MTETLALVGALVGSAGIGGALVRWRHHCPPPKVLYGVRQMEHKLQPDLPRRERRAKARKR